MRCFAILVALVSMTFCESAHATFSYSELTADGLAIRYLLDINDSGESVGSVPNNLTGTLDGFVRNPDGTAQFWTTPGILAYPTAINNAGTVVGTNIPLAGGLPAGFQRDALGSETPYNFPGALGTVPFGISNDDTYTGFYITPNGRRGFVEQSSSGLSRSVEYPGSTETQLFGINDVGKVGGAYYDAAGAAFPFIYDIELETFELIAPPASGNFVITSINDDGDAIVFGMRDVSENYADLRSFYRDSDTGVMTELFYPGAVETYGYDIDDQGTIIGYYQDGNGDFGGFQATRIPEPSSMSILVLACVLGVCRSGRSLSGDFRKKGCVGKIRKLGSRSRTTVFATALLLAVLPGVAGAAPVVFDFESEPDTGFNSGAYTSLTLNSGAPDHLELNITRPGTPNQFDVYDVHDIGNPTLPISWGSRSLNPWFSNAGTAFVGTFDRPVRAVSIDMGDFGQDPDDLLLQAFDGVGGTGSLLDESSFQLPSGGSDFTQAKLKVDAGLRAIRSIRFMGGTLAYDTPFGTFSIPNSVYYDNLTVTIPEPSGFTILALGGIGGFYLFRNKRNSEQCL